MVEGKDDGHSQEADAGYIFVYYFGSDGGEAIRILPARVRDRLLGGFFYFLKYPDGAYELRDGDKDFSLMLLENDGVIGRTEVWKEGDRIRLKEGAFAGVKTDILKVDRRNERMQIEIELT